MELHPRVKRMSSIGAQDAMLDVIATHALTANDIRGLAEKGDRRALLHNTALYPQRNYSIQHKRVVQVDPKCQPRVPNRQSRRIKRAQFPCATAKIVIERTGAQGSVVHGPAIDSQPT